jgi:hypothetical protein
MTSGNAFMSSLAIQRIDLLFVSSSVNEIINRTCIFDIFY